jgi:hypothetical protein
MQHELDKEKLGEGRGHQESNLTLHTNEVCSCTSAPIRPQFITNELAPQ